MTPTEIIETVLRASVGGEIKMHTEGESLVLTLEPVLQAAAKAAMELEREACAKLCEDVLRSRSEPSDAALCVAAIRSRA